MGDSLAAVGICHCRAQHRNRGAAVFSYLFALDFPQAFTAWLVDFLLTCILCAILFYTLDVFIKKKKQPTRLQVVAFYRLLFICLAVAVASFVVTVLSEFIGYKIAGPGN